MAINLDKMRAKRDQLQNKGSGNSVTWRPDDGDQTIRILPTSDGDPFKELWFHYNVGKNAGFLCPKKNHGQDCPVCEFASSLWREGSQNDDKDSLKMAKSLFARQRFFSPIVVRGEEDRGARIWGYGKMAYETLLNLVLNPEYGDITDVDEGTDLNLNYGKPAGASFPQTKLQPRRRTSPLGDESVGGEEWTAELLENIPDIDTLFECPTSESVGSMLDEYLSSDATAESGASEEEKYNKTETSADTGTSVDRAFEELLGASGA